MRSIVVLIAALGAAGASFAETINFDNATLGAVPPGWNVAMTHKGGAPKWEVVKDETAPSKPYVLAQVSEDATGGRFPLAVYEKASVKDGILSAKFKAISGSVDQAGLIWRYKDPGNYYLVRANALEDNVVLYVVLYKVENGQRIALAPKGTPSKTYGVKHRVPKQTWKTLSVAFQGNVFTVSFDGEKLFDVEDSAFTTAGKVGMWTKADSVTYFDNFQIEGK
jgi:hypothetical protein